MIPLIVYTVAAFGLAYIVGHSTISLPIRRYLGGTPAQFAVDGAELKSLKPPVPGALGPIGDLLCALMECPACFGFWTGLAAPLFGLSLVPDNHLLSVPIVLGFYTSGANFVLARLTRLS